jgi:hypothetical protein
VNEVREYACEGQRLLAESAFSQSEIARLMKRPKQRVSDWRSGRCRPAPEDRALLERTASIPARTWDSPPTRREPAPPPSPAQPAPAAPIPASVDLPPGDEDLPALGLPALEALARRLRALEPTLPPRERVSALQAEARVLAVHEQLRQREADARTTYLASPEFLAEARALLAVVHHPAKELRAHLARLGVELPAPASALAVADAPPATAADIDDLVQELRTAEGFRAAGEPVLALQHVLGLGVQDHAAAIAALVVDDADRTARLLGLLDGADAAVLRRAIERCMAVRDVAALPAKSRRAVAELLEAHGLGDVAREIRGSP